MTKTWQEFFEVGVRKIVAQGVKAIDKSFCVYATQDGRHCIFGMLIPEELANELSVWNVSAESLIDLLYKSNIITTTVEIDEKFKLWGFENINTDIPRTENMHFFGSMQHILHDNCNWTVEGFKSACVRFAAKFNLNAEFINDLDFSNFKEGVS